MKFLIVLSAIAVAAHGAPQVFYGAGGFGYGYGLAAPAVVAAAPAAAEEEAPAAEVAPAPAIAYAGLPYAGLPLAGYPYAGLPHAGLPYAGLPYTVAGLPKLELPAAPAISYSLGGVPFIVPAVAAAAESEAAPAVEVVSEE